LSEYGRIEDFQEVSSAHLNNARLRSNISENNGGKTLKLLRIKLLATSYNLVQKSCPSIEIEWMRTYWRFPGG